MTFLNNKKITIQDIADQIGVSKSTVSKAFSGSTDVGEQTKEKIMLCAAEMGYQVSPAKIKKHKNIVVFIYGIHYSSMDQFGYEIILGIQSAAADDNVGVVVFTINDEQLHNGTYYRLLTEKDYAGIFFLGFRPHVDFLEKTKDSGIPMVIFDNYIDSPLTVRIGCDNCEGIGRAVKHLYDKGHRKIGFLGGEVDSIVTAERKSAFIDALKEYSLEPPENAVQCGYFSGKGNEEKIITIARSGVTAIVCASDNLACNAVQELTKVGYNIPDDISITGYDDLPLAKYSTPPITTIRQNRIRIGNAAYRIMVDFKVGISLYNVSLKTELVERESVKDISGSAR